MDNTRETIKSKLKQGDCKITFTKADGTLRTMICTLQEGLIPPQEPKKTDRVKKENDDVLAVWDLELSSWRSFRFDSILSVV
jgi:hypothetical protein